MERARALVAESGTAGERVVVTVPEFQRDIGRYFAGAARPTSATAPRCASSATSYFQVIFDPRSRVQIGFIGWSPGLREPVDVHRAELQLRVARPLPPAAIAGSMRQVDRAHAAEGADAAGRWAAIDRRVTDLAPAVPLTNRRSVDIVSPRVGNVQHHVVGYTLLEQLWVQ